MKRLLACFALLGAGCAYHNPTEPAPVTTSSSAAPASIQLTTSSRVDYQTSVTATVYTADRHVVPNISIAFSTAAGTITSQQTKTNANGAAVAVVSTPTTTIVSATIGVVSASVEVTGAAPPVVPDVPPVLPPAPPDAPPPLAVINVSPVGTTGTPLVFGVAAIGGQTWTWTFGDGSPAIQTTAYSVTHTYTSAGVYTPTVSSAGTKSGSATVTISDPPLPPPTPGPTSATLVPVITCTPGTHGTTPTVCNVSSLTYGATTIASAAVTNVTWDWGDGPPVSTTAAPVASHTYLNVGVYPLVVTVTATTVDGPKTGSTSKAVTIP